MVRPHPSSFHRRMTETHERFMWPYEMAPRPAAPAADPWYGRQAMDPELLQQVHGDAADARLDAALGARPYPVLPTRGDVRPASR